MAYLVWQLENYSDSADFERLCVDLLREHGYPEIVPIGGMRDAGRDAEIRLPSGQLILFAFSTEAKWAGKLQKDADKSFGKHEQIVQYVFVTSRKVTGEKRDKLRQEHNKKYKWELIILDQEWLRSRIEYRPEVKQRYFPQDSWSRSTSFETQTTFDGNRSSADELFESGDFESAVVEYKRILKEHPTNTRTLYNLAVSYFELNHFQEALNTIKHGLDIAGKNDLFLNLKAIILVEFGVRTASKQSLLQAKEILLRTPITSHWRYFFNLGNLYYHLGDWGDALNAFSRAIRMESSSATLWTNLGNTYQALGEIEKAKESYSEAIRCDPMWAEAYANLGVLVLQTDDDKNLEAVHLLEKARILSGDAQYWADGWYWLTKAYLRLEQKSKALEILRRGSEFDPSNSTILKLKAELLSQLWRTDLSYLDEAIQTQKLQFELTPTVYERLELAIQYFAKGYDDHAVRLISERYPHVRKVRELLIEFGRGPTKQLRGRLATENYLPLFIKFRRNNPISDLGGIVTSQISKLAKELDDRLAVIFTMVCDLLDGQDKILQAQEFDRSQGVFIEETVNQTVGFFQTYMNAGEIEGSRNERMALVGIASWIYTTSISYISGVFRIDHYIANSLLAEENTVENDIVADLMNALDVAD